MGVVAPKWHIYYPRHSYIHLEFTSFTNTDNGAADYTRWSSKSVMALAV